ncbi:MAG TPA: hypothetical protein VI756_15000 [Blastocatellia bacterium]
MRHALTCLVLAAILPMPAHAKPKHKYVCTLIDPQPERPDRIRYSDQFLSVAFDMTLQNIPLAIRNLTNRPMTLDWNQVSYVDINGIAHRVIHNGIRFMEKEQPMVASPIPPGATLSDLIYPADLIQMETNIFGHDPHWNQPDLFPKADSREAAAFYTSRRIGIFLPITWDGSVHDYQFTIEMTVVPV